MDMQYLSQAKVQETEREIARIQREAAAEGTMAKRHVAAVSEPRTVSAMPLRLMRRAWRQAGALRPAA